MRAAKCPAKRARCKGGNGRRNAGGETAWQVRHGRRRRATHTQRGATRAGRGPPYAQAKGRTRTGRGSARYHVRRPQERRRRPPCGKRLPQDASENLFRYRIAASGAEQAPPLSRITAQAGIRSTRVDPCPTQADARTTQADSCSTRTTQAGARRARTAKRLPRKFFHVSRLKSLVFRKLALGRISKSPSSSKRQCPHQALSSRRAAGNRKRTPPTRQPSGNDSENSHFETRSADFLPQSRMADTKAPLLPRSRGRPHDGTPPSRNQGPHVKAPFPSRNQGPHVKAPFPSQRREAARRRALPEKPGATLPGKRRRTARRLFTASPQSDARRTQRRGLRHLALRIGVKDGCRVDAVALEGYGSRIRKTEAETPRAEAGTR